MKSLQRFYDRYHQKNDTYAKVITDTNFTYFYTLRWWQEGGKRRPKLKILDIGCGVGTLSLYLASKGHRVTGIDISPRAIDIARHAQQQLGFKNVKFVQGEIKTGAGEYDYVVCSEVIEHIQDDQAFLQKIRSNLKKNGQLLLTTPSRENVLFKLGYYQKFDREVGHLRRYTQEGLIRLLEKNKFEVLALKEVEGPLRNILFTSKLGVLIRFIRGPLIPLFHYFDAISAHLFGASDIQVLAKRIK